MDEIKTKTEWTRIVPTGKKYGILSEFEVGDSGYWEQRMLVSGISKKKARELLDISRKVLKKVV